MARLDQVSDLVQRLGRAPISLSVFDCERLHSFCEKNHITSLRGHQSRGNSRCKSEPLLPCFRSPPPSDESADLQSLSSCLCLWSPFSRPLNLLSSVRPAKSENPTSCQKTFYRLNLASPCLRQGISYQNQPWWAKWWSGQEEIVNFENGFKKKSVQVAWVPDFFLIFFLNVHSTLFIHSSWNASTNSRLPWRATLPPLPPLLLLPNRKQQSARVLPARIPMCGTSKHAL